MLKEKYRIIENTCKTISGLTSYTVKRKPWWSPIWLNLPLFYRGSDDVYYFIQNSDTLELAKVQLLRWKHRNMKKEIVYEE